MVKTRSRQIRRLNEEYRREGGFRAAYNKRKEAGLRVEDIARSFGLSYYAMRYWISAWNREDKINGSK